MLPTHNKLFIKSNVYRAHSIIIMTRRQSIITSTIKGWTGVNKAVPYQ